MELIPLVVFWVLLFETVRLLGMCGAESRRSMYSLVIGVWAIVALYAVLHDQYIVRISPAHFTLFHDPMWGIRYPKILAARVDSMPQVSSAFVLKSVAAVVVLTELVAAFSGAVAYYRGQGIYPDEFYHATELPQ